MIVGVCVDVVCPRSPFSGMTKYDLGGVQQFVNYDFFEIFFGGKIAIDRDDKLPVFVFVIIFSKIT